MVSAARRTSSCCGNDISKMKSTATMAKMTLSSIPTVEEATGLSRQERNRLSAMRSRLRTKTEVANLENRINHAINRKNQLNSSISTMQSECEFLEKQLKLALSQNSRPNDTRQQVQQQQQQQVHQQQFQLQQQPQQQPQVQRQQQCDPSDERNAFVDWVLSTATSPTTTPTMIEHLSAEVKTDELDLVSPAHSHSNSHSLELDLPISNDQINIQSDNDNDDMDFDLDVKLNDGNLLDDLATIATTDTTTKCASAPPNQENLSNLSVHSDSKTATNTTTSPTSQPSPTTATSPPPPPPTATTTTTTTTEWLPDLTSEDLL